MNEIESNKYAWSKLSEDHYKHYKKALMDGTHHLNPYIVEELGDISGKSVIHLQCNTGADTMLLAQRAGHVTGVDFVPENLYYAYRLAEDLERDNVDFIESDILGLSDIHHDKYDVVFTSEGVLGWLPELDVWARTIRGLLKDTGFFYIFDSHPFFLSFDENRLDKQIYDIKYPYFGKSPDVDDSIGGYAAETKTGVKAYFWMHTLSEIINALIKAGLHIEMFNEYTQNFWDSGNMKFSDKSGMYEYDYNTDKYPMSFSLRASVYPGK